MELFNKTFFKFTGAFAALIALVFLFLAAFQEFGGATEKKPVPIPVPLEARA